jgi:hypothetical protein
MRSFVQKVFLGSLLLMACCIDPVEIKSVTYDELLIVEGYLSGDTKHHKILLSTTSRINERKVIAEEGASVTIQENNGGIITLTENEPGAYYTPIYAGAPGKTYQLFIETKDGKKYTSSEVKFKATPEIKDIYAEYFNDRGYDDNGVAIYLDTEDPSGLTRFYRWEFEETYEIKTPFPSNFIWIGGNDVIFRDQPVDHCWATDSSENIMVATTANLQFDKITKHRLTFIPATSPVMRIKYSLLVRQYALDENGYLFWKMIHDVNETQGSLFDIQTGAVRGNIKADKDASEFALGYFDAGVVAEKRVFFSPADFAASGYKPPKYLTVCLEYVPVQITSDKIGAYMQKNHETMEISEATGAGIVTLELLPKYCCNCTDKGTNIKPSYWK